MSKFLSAIFITLQLVYASPYEQKVAEWETCAQTSNCPTSSPSWPIICCVAPADLSTGKKTCRPVSFCATATDECAEETPNPIPQERIPLDFGDGPIS